MSQEAGFSGELPPKSPGGIERRVWGRFPADPATMVPPTVAQDTLWTVIAKMAPEAFQLGRHDEIEKQFLQAITEAEKLGAADLRLASSLNDLGGLYLAQGKYALSETLCQRSLSILEKLVPADHPFLGTALNNLGQIYDNQGRYAEAEPLLKRAPGHSGEGVRAEQPARGLYPEPPGPALPHAGPAHPSRAVAAPFLRDPAFRLRTGPPETAAGMGNLANLYLRQGRLPRPSRS